MIRRLSLMLLALGLCGGSLLAQPRFGSVAGVVLLANGEPATGAVVRLDAFNGQHGGHHGAHLEQFTGPQGGFLFPSVPVGPGNISASMRANGFDSEIIEIVPNQTTMVTLTLARPDTTNPEHDSLTVVELVGTAIVLAPDSGHRITRYFLDVDEDNVPDYRLNFGPEAYVPGNGATRPAHGDEITVVGGLFGYATPPLVVVFRINGLFWRDARHHPGRGGGDHEGRNCDPDSLIRVELDGFVQMVPCDGPHGEDDCYGLDVRGSHEPEFILDFGGPDYDPGNGATRPEDHDQVSIVGGLIYCPREHLPIVIVYEINGLLWREPGDTTGFNTVNTAIDEPVAVGVPESYLTASNYPNPFNPVTTIHYSIPQTGNVRLTVYDLTGRVVALLVDQRQEAGSYVTTFDGRSLASGIYFYRIDAGGFSFTNRMVLLK